MKRTAFRYLGSGEQERMVESAEKGFKVALEFRLSNQQIGPPIGVICSVFVQKNGRVAGDTLPLYRHTTKLFKKAMGLWERFCETGESA
jgi:tRNA U34 5-methylaminomethyl-2-thiouridine-forming methyltransferase MnmC